MGEVALAALAMDAAMGWPGWLYRIVGHPVGGFARIIDGLEARWNRASYSEALRRLAGVATVLILLTLTGGIGWIVQAAAFHWMGSAGWIVVALLAFPALAQRSLFDHMLPIINAPDLPEARRAVGMIVGRDTGALDDSGVARAAIESLAESFCDGIVAPAFWLLLFGLPGVWAYKAINTADSLIGHKEERWRAFGWAAARTDDLMNLVPARLAGVLICLAGRGGWRTLWRDHGKHASPNAGWPEAAMAGVLVVRLAGPIAYDGVPAPKPWIGEGGRDAVPADIGRALAIYVAACLGLWVIAGTVAWLR